MGYKNAVKDDNNIYIDLYISLVAMLGRKWQKNGDKREYTETTAEKYFKLLTGSKSPVQTVMT